MALRIVRFGEPHHPNEDLRINTMRRPPHGVPEEEFASHDFYDVQMPLLSPTPKLVKQILAAQSTHGEKGWNTFVRHFRTETCDGDTVRLFGMLTTLSHQTNLSVRCYYESEAHRHRSVLHALLKERGTKLTP